MAVAKDLMIARGAIVAAILLQSIGKIAYGTLLVAFPTPWFVFISFLLTAVFFFAFSGRSAGDVSVGPLLLLNISTALAFICFFYALKLIEPAIVGAVEIGIGPVLVVLITVIMTGERPEVKRVIVCGGILAGGCVLAFAALEGTGFASNGQSAIFGLVASAAAGLGAVLITMASKTLIGRGWKFGAVLAHRFYLILPISLALSFGADGSNVEWSGTFVATIVAVSFIGVLAPLYLLQVGIGRCDPYTVMVTMAALPVFTFIFEAFSPLYSWSWFTAVGLAIVMAFLIVDVLGKKT